jgi:hypothetical protein
MIKPAEMGPPSDNPYKIWSKPVISKEKNVFWYLFEMQDGLDGGSRCKIGY